MSTEALVKKQQQKCNKFIFRIVRLFLVYEVKTNNLITEF